MSLTIIREEFESLLILDERDRIIAVIHVADVKPGRDGGKKFARLNVYADRKLRIERPERLGLPKGFLPGKSVLVGECDPTR